MTYDPGCTKHGDIMTEFWETSFQEKGAMSGADPTSSARSAAELFRERGYTDILIPGIGYGRNARPFLDAGMRVSGIEISETAVRMLQSTFGGDVRVYRGSVAEMPFDQGQYDGIFSFALLHLLDEPARRTFIQACYAQLRPGGTMVFTTIADTAPMFGTGKQIADRLFETMPGVRLFFYNNGLVQADFQAYGLTRVHQVSESPPQNTSGPELDFLWIECVKAA
jgi:SAM-dependent methyltransferase